MLAKSENLAKPVNIYRPQNKMTVYDIDHITRDMSVLGASMLDPSLQENNNKQFHKMVEKCGTFMYLAFMPAKSEEWVRVARNGELFVGVRHFRGIKAVQYRIGSVVIDAVCGHGWWRTIDQPIPLPKGFTMEVRIFQEEMTAYEGGWIKTNQPVATDFLGDCLEGVRVSNDSKKNPAYSNGRSSESVHTGHQFSVVNGVFKVHI